MCEKKITIDDLKEFMEDREKKCFSLPLRKRIKLVYLNFRINWILRKYYKPFWFVSVIDDGLRVIFKISKKKKM